MSDDRFIAEIKEKTDGLVQEGPEMRRFRAPPVFEPVNLLKSDNLVAIIGAANTVIELGHPATLSLCLGMVTERDDLVVEGRVTVVGKELQELSPGRHPFALIVIAKVGKASESSRRALVRGISSCDRLAGCMARVSSGRIWVRFSQEALDLELTLKDMGWFLLSELKKEQGRFMKVEIILVGGHENHIEELRSVAEGLAEERNIRYKEALVEKMACETGLDCDECPETETCKVLKDAVAVARKKSRTT